MTQAADVVVRRQIVVQAPIERAFAVFTERFGDFKPPEHNLLGVAIAETVFEPKVGGTSTTGASMAASAAGPGCSPTNRRTGSCSAGTSARSGRSRPTRKEMPTNLATLKQRLEQR